MSLAYAKMLAGMREIIVEFNVPAARNSDKIAAQRGSSNPPSPFKKPRIYAQAR